MMFRFRKKSTLKLSAYFRTIQTENNRKIVLDEYSSDVILLSSVETVEQLNTLAFVAEQVISLENHKEAKEEIEEIISCLFADVREEEKGNTQAMLERKDRWYEEVRSIDALGCLFRMRNLGFEKNEVVV